MILLKWGKVFEVSIVERYQAGTNVVLLDPEVAEAFPTSESVNEALRLLMQIALRKNSNKSLEQTET